MQAVTAAAGGNVAGADISFGFTLSAPPTPHYIPIGAPLPLGCTGTAASPDAQPGHLCVFEVVANSAAANLLVGPSGGPAVTATGAVLFGISAAAGQMVITTFWAVRPIALAPPSAKIKGTLPPNKGRFVPSVTSRLGDGSAGCRPPVRFGFLAIQRDPSRFYAASK